MAAGGGLKKAQQSRRRQLLRKHIRRSDSGLWTRRPRRTTTAEKLSLVAWHARYTFDFMYKIPIPTVLDLGPAAWGVRGENRGMP